MSKRSILGIVTLLFLALNVNAQVASNRGSKSNLNQVNAFTHGTNAGYSIENNFKNLFKTVPQLIDNPDSLEFLGYKYITTIQDKSEAIDYFLKNLHENAPMVYYYVIGNSTHIALYRIQDFNREGSVKILKTWIERKGIDAGYKVYQINFILNGEKIHHYVFINPKTNQVVLTKFTFFGSIPQPL